MEENTLSGAIMKFCCSRFITNLFLLWIILGLSQILAIMKG